MRKKMKNIVALVSVVVILFVIAFLGYPSYLNNMRGTNVAFQSSDGKWAQAEVLMKGIDFKLINENFKSYKLKCKKPSMVLQRITNKPSIFTLSRFFDDYEEEKWSIEYSELHSSLKNAKNLSSFSNSECSD